MTSNSVKRKCPKCNGNGRFVSRAKVGTCFACQGRGYVFGRKKQTARSDAPKGIGP